MCRQYRIDNTLRFSASLREEGKGVCIETEKPQRIAEASVMGWRRPTFPQIDAVSSALRGLTSLFGMGRGGPPRYSHHVYHNMSLTWSGRRTLRNRAQARPCRLLCNHLVNAKLSGY